MVEDRQRWSAHGARSRVSRITSRISLIQSHLTLTDDLPEAISAPDYVTVGLIVILNPSDQKLWRSSTIHRTTVTPVNSVLFHCSRPPETVMVEDEYNQVTMI